MRRALLVSPLGLLTLLTACGSDMHPFVDVWQGTCSAVDQPLLVEFSIDDDFNPRKLSGEYVGRLIYELGDYSSHDYLAYSGDRYFWAIEVDASTSYAATTGWQRAPYPDTWTDALGNQPLELEAEAFTDYGMYAEISGTCSYGDEPGTFRLEQNDPCKNNCLFSCASAGGAGSRGTAGLLALGALAMVFRRRGAPALRDR